MNYELLLESIPAAATNTLAFVSYLAAIVLWLIISLKVKNHKLLLENIEKLPEKDRIKAFKTQIHGVTLQSGLSPEQWLKAKIHQYFFISFLTICAVVVIITAMALFDGEKIKPVSLEEQLKSFELGQSLEYVKDEIDLHIRYKNDNGADDAMVDLFYVKHKLKTIKLLEYLEFNRKDELSMLRTKSLTEWEGTNEAWELISRVEGFLEKKSKKLFYLYRISFILEKIHATIQENPEKDISTWHEELIDYINRLSKIDNYFEELDISKLKNKNNDIRYTEFWDNIKKLLEKRVK